jgi:hypothetical protein
MKSKLGRVRWVVEQRISWLLRFDGSLALLLILVLGAVGLCLRTSVAEDWIEPGRHR